MVKAFDKNIFTMLLAIMVGTIIITYFVADIKARSEEEEKYSTRIDTIEKENILFTNNFMKSSVLLDQAREDRAYANYHFDLALLWYQSSFTVKNSSIMELYKSRGLDNCTSAMPIYNLSQLNFEEAKKYFTITKSLTDYTKYINIVDVYIKLTASGSELTILRYDACKYLKYLTENLTFDSDTNNIIFLENVTEIMDMFNMTMVAYGGVLETYNEYQDEIDEYEFFDEIR